MIRNTKKKKTKSVQKEKKIIHSSSGSQAAYEKKRAFARDR